MRSLIRLYGLALKLYPRTFRARFGHEMEEVFRAGLEEAREQRTLAVYVLHEALGLPGSLLDVYVWSIRTGTAAQMAVSSAGGGGTIGASLPGEGWGAALLAGLPNLVAGIFIVGSTLLGEIKGFDPNVFGLLLIAVMSILLLGASLFSLHKGWRRWSASWLVYMFMFAVILLSLAANEWATRFASDDGWVYQVQMMSFPLLLAYLLYKIACTDRLRALLAAVPPMAWLWSYFQEFVPAVPRALAWGWLFVLAFGASVLMLRTRRFAVALGLAMIVPIFGGFPFAYLGVYMGGTLPFTEPGPSLLEVWRQYLPFLAAILSIALGPQLAVKLRALGRNSAGGKVFYRLALAGVLLALVATLLEWMMATGGTPRWVYPLLAVRKLWPIAAAVIYLAGFGPWMWEALLSRDNLTVLRLAALFILLPGVPLVLFLTIPNWALGSSPLDWLLPVLEFGWVLAAAWAALDPKLDST